MDVIDKESTFISKKLIQKEGCEASIHQLFVMKKAIYSYKALYTGSCSLQNCKVKV